MKIKLLVLAFCLIATNLSAQTITSKTSGGNWNDPNTWIGGVVPGTNNDVIIDGTVSVTTGTSCNNITINGGKFLQNGGGYGWLALHVNNCTNNGTIRNNPDGNAFQIVVWGNAVNNGVWNCQDTFFPAKFTQYISQGTGRFFDTQVRRSDNGGYTFDTGALIASSDLTFTKNLNLEGYIAGTGTVWGSFEMANHNLTLKENSQPFRGTIKNTTNLTMLDSSYLSDITFEGNTTIKGRGMISNGGVTFKGNITVADTLQNCGSYGWLTVHIDGSLTNNGFIKNNYAGNALQVEVWGDVHNNGIWNNYKTFFPGKNDQHISQATGKFFDTEIRYSNEGGHTFNTGKLIAASDLTFTKQINLNGYIPDVGNQWGTLYMNGKNLTLKGVASIFNGTVNDVNDLTILEDARLYDITFIGNTNIKGRGRIQNGNVTFIGATIVTDTLQNCGSYGWLTVHIDGSLTNNGIIKNNNAGNSLQVEVWGDVHNNGIWNNYRTFFPGKNDQHISQTAGKFFDTEVRYSNEGGIAFNTGKLIATSDLTFTKQINLNGYVTDVGNQWGTLYMNGKNLTLKGVASIFNGGVNDVNDLTILEDARLYDITFNGNTNIKGRGRIENGNVAFRGTTTVIDTLQNCGGYGWLTPDFYGELINYGTIKNNDQGNQLELEIHGNAYNYGSWKNSWVQIYTDGVDRIISGTFNTQLNVHKSGDPAAGRIIVNEKLVSPFELHLREGVELVVNQGTQLINTGTISDNGFVTNNGVFTSKHDLNWWSPLNPGLNAKIDLADRASLVDVIATSYKNMTHPLMNSSINQWLRVIGNGAVGSYKITLYYADELLNGNDESNLELFLSPDSGKTWKKISTPLNTTRDLSNNTIVVGNDTYPITAGFGDFILSSGGKIYVPSISAAIGGRKQIRVGPPNRYSISYWNNGNLPTDKFAIVLNTNRGVHIKSVVTKEIATGNTVEVPIDSLTYDGYKDEVILLVQGLGPKEVRTFDVVLTSEPGTLEKTMEPITFTAALLWIGGAMIEEYISNTIVEGCYEMWRPVRHDQTLTDASIECVKNSVNKAVNVENGVKGIAKKGAEEIIKKTGRVAVWPVMLAKDVFDCLGNTFKGMKDYVNGNFDKQDKELVKVTSWDPNAKEGPTGYGSQGFMATAAPMSYTIFFENKKEATAAAYEIVIVDTLDPNVFDVNTVEFGTMSHSMGIPTRDGNILRWQFTEIELPPNATPPEGEGWVKFTVRPKNNLPTGTEIKNRAVIKFDLNSWLATNLYVNTLDYDPPVTTPTYLYRLSGKNEIELVWENNDGSGSGVKNTQVYMANNDGPFTLAATVNTNSAIIPVEPNILYKFYTLSTDNVGNTEVNPTKTMEIMTAVEDGKPLPEKFELSQNYPNPFNPSTTISFALPERGLVELKIYSITGEEITTLIKEQKDAGYYHIKWKPEELASGVYLYQIKFKNNLQSRKMIYLK